VSVDDFGTGHSSLSYLTRLPISALRSTSRSCRKSVAREAPRRIVAQAIISLGTTQVKVVGEGVETGPQFDFLKKQPATSAGYFQQAVAGGSSSASRRAVCDRRN